MTSSPSSRLRQAYSYMDHDGATHHPIDDIEPEPMALSYRATCEELLRAFTESIDRLIQGTESPESIGAFWLIARYDGTQPAAIDIDLDFSHLVNTKFVVAFRSIQVRIMDALSLIKLAKNPQQEAACIALNLGLSCESIRGRSMTDAGQKFGVGRSAISNKVRSVEYVTGYTSDYQKPKSARPAYRKGRKEYLEAAAIHKSPTPNHNEPT